MSKISDKPQTPKKAVSMNFGERSAKAPGVKELTRERSRPPFLVHCFRTGPVTT